jgi:uncharacterized protein DUF4238
MPNNKRQHFVPKSTLKRFASDADAKQINLVNLKRAKVIRGASLRDQCYRDYFYGESGDLERQIALMEGQFDASISSIVQTESIAPTLKTTTELATLLSLQRSRTLLAEEEINAMMDQFSKLMMYGKIDREILEKVRIGIKDAAAFNVSQSLIVSPIMYDLKHFLLRNRTDVPFVISDNPVIQTNWFCHTKLPGRSGAGIGKAGLQVVMPISPRHAVLLHDANVYGAADSARVIEITKEEDADLLNELQWLNAYKNIYFSPTWSKEKIEQAMSWKRPTEILPQLNRLKAINNDGLYVPSGKTIFESPDADETRELVHFHGRELPKDFRIRGVTIRPKPRFWDNGSAASPKRDYVWDQIVKEFASAIERKQIKFSDFWLFVGEHRLAGQIGAWIRRAKRD